MSYREQLPFARGATLGDGHDTPASGFGAKFIGRIYEAIDDKYGTGTIVRLRIVSNESGSAITAARKCYRFDTGAKEFGRAIKGLANADGQVVKPLDDHYTTGFSIASYDCFYVVEEGPCSVLSDATDFAMATHSILQVESGGLLLATTAAASDFVIGTLDQAATTSDTSTSVLVWVRGGLSAETA